MAFPICRDIYSDLHIPVKTPDVNAFMISPSRCGPHTSHWRHHRNTPPFGTDRLSLVDSHGRPERLAGQGRMTLIEGLGCVLSHAEVEYPGIVLIETPTTPAQAQPGKPTHK